MGDSTHPMKPGFVEAAIAGRPARRLGMNRVLRVFPPGAGF